MLVVERDVSVEVLGLVFSFIVTLKGLLGLQLGVTCVSLLTFSSVQLLTKNLSF